MTTVYRAHKLSTDEVSEHAFLSTLAEFMSARDGEFIDYKWTKHVKTDMLESDEVIDGETYDMARSIFYLARRVPVEKAIECTTTVAMVVNMEVTGNLNGLLLDDIKLLQLALKPDSNVFLSSTNIDTLSVKNSRGEVVTTEEDDINRIPDDVYSCVEEDIFD